jgi:DNA-directed RNA polymerase alpha subunit
VGTQNYGRFVISPLENGYGTTLGNALRRVLLSSLDGLAVTSLRVADVPHEFSTIPGVREDMMLFILNVKQIRFRLSGSDADEPMGHQTPGIEPGEPHFDERTHSGAPDATDERTHSDAPSLGALSSLQDWTSDVSAMRDAASVRSELYGVSATSDASLMRDAGSTSGSMTGAQPQDRVGVGRAMRLHLSVSGQGVVTAGDIICPPEIEIVNPELYLFTVDDPDAELDIEMVVSAGRGYSPSEERGKLPIGELPVDAVFSPIRKVNYDVTPARVGQMTNYDTLTLEIWTDGTLRPQRALDISAKLLIRHFALFAGVEALEAPAEPIAVPSAQPGMGPAIRAGTVTPGLAPAQSQAGPSAAGQAAGRAYDVPIEELDLSVRVYNCLKRTGITKVGEVLDKMEKGPDEMLAIRNFGIKSLIELRNKLIEKEYLGEDDFPLEED